MERESIDDEDIVNRNVLWPFMYIERRDVIDPRQVFVFLERSGERRESVIWRKYAPNVNDVHQIGLEKENRHNAREGVKTFHRYTGTMEALVQKIKEISYQGRYWFDVTHEPFNADICHAEIAICGRERATVIRISKNDRLYLIDELFRVFSSLFRRPG